ncbi:MAG: hypothetical protein KKH97_05290, partial [Proteobacteria bacterium]|nr:hypothetical protein [Pseudomonadota bacterium]
MLKNMFRNYLILFCFFSFHITAYTDNVSTSGSEAVEELRLITVADFHSDILNNDRDIRIYLPSSYQSGNQSYPVLYLQDGQGMFAPGGWKVESTYDSLVAAGRIEEVILVGID